MSSKVEALLHNSEFDMMYKEIDMTVITLEELSNENFRKNLLSELNSMHNLLGIDHEKRYVDVEFGDEDVKCGLWRSYDGNVQAEVYLDKLEYNIDELSLEKGVHFVFKPETKIKIKNLKENTREIADNDPKLIAESLEISDLYNIYKHVINKDISLTLRCSYYGYVLATKSARCNIHDIHHIGIKSIYIKLNAALLDKLQVSFTDKFFEYNDRVSKIAKLLQWDKVTSISWSDCIKIVGTTGDIITKHVIESNDNKDRALLRMVLEYLFDELEQNFEKFGIEAYVVWEESK